MLSLPPTSGKVGPSRSVAQKFSKRSSSDLQAIFRLPARCFVTHLGERHRAVTSRWLLFDVLDLGNPVFLQPAGLQVRGSTLAQGAVVLSFDVPVRTLTCDPLRQPYLEAPAVRFAFRQHPHAPLSGDFFEVIDHGNGKVTALIADVSGNGPVAAALGEQVRREARRRAVSGASPAAILGGTNTWLERQDLLDQFVCATVVRIDSRSGEAVVASAGHFLPLLKARPGHAVMLDGPAGPPLGVVAHHIFPSTAFRLSLGDILILFTDGISDVLAGPFDPLGEQGLTALVAGGPLELDRLCQVVFEGTSASVGADAMVLALGIAAPADDATMPSIWPSNRHEQRSGSLISPPDIRPAKGMNAEAL